MNSRTSPRTSSRSEACEVWHRFNVPYEHVGHLSCASLSRRNMRFRTYRSAEKRRLLIHIKSPNETNCHNTIASSRCVEGKRGDNHDADAIPSSFELWHKMHSMR